MATKSTSAPHSSIKQTRESRQPDTSYAWREWILDGILRGILSFGIIALVFSIIYIIRNPQVSQPIPPVVLAIFFGGIYLFTFVAFLRRTLSFKIRANAPLVLLYSIGTLNFYLYGLEGNGHIFFLATVVLTTLLFGLRSGIGVSVASFIILVGITWFLAMGWMTFPFEHLGATAEPSAWLVETMVFLFLTAIVIIPMGVLLRNQEASLRITSEKAQLIEKTLSRSEQQGRELARKTARLERIEEELRGVVEELETPIVMLTNDLMLVPIIGRMDTRRMETITSRLLAHVHRQRTHKVILDVSGVATVDTEVAQGLLRMVQSLHLLGSKIVVTGISAAVAMTMTEIGIDLQEVEIANSPQDVLQEHMTRKRTL